MHSNAVFIPRWQQKPTVLSHLSWTTWCSCCYVTWAPTPQGKYEEAEALYLRAMEIMEATLGKEATLSKEATLGKNHSLYSIIMGHLAGLLMAQVREQRVSLHSPYGMYHTQVDALIRFCRWAEIWTGPGTGVFFLCSVVVFRI